MDAIDFGSDYGYQDYTSASLEAGTFADQAWQAGDMDAFTQWNTTSWDAWNTGTDLYVAGADPFGAESPSTAEGYFPTTDTWSSYTGTDSTWSAAATDPTWTAATPDSSWSATTTDSTWSAATPDTSWSAASTDTSWSAAATDPSWSAASTDTSWSASAE